MNQEVNRIKKNCPVCGEGLSADMTCIACGFFEENRLHINWVRIFKVSIVVILFAAISISIIFWVSSKRMTIVNGHYELTNHENSVVYVSIENYPSWKDTTDKIDALKERIRRLGLEKKEKFSILKEERRIERLILNRKNELHFLVEDIRKLELQEISVVSED